MSAEARLHLAEELRIIRWVTRGLRLLPAVPAAPKARRHASPLAGSFP